LLNQMQLNEPASMTLSADGNLVVYAQDGLWQVDASGQQSQLAQGLPIGNANSAALMSPAGDRYILSGEPRTVYTYNRDGLLLWQNPVSDVTGESELSLYNNVLLLTTRDGSIVALQASTGALCNAARMYGDSRSILWHNLGADGILRVALADQIVGFDWKTFLGACHQ
jgi:hypothetical protein